MNRSDFTKNSPGHLEPIPEGVLAFIPDPLPPPNLRIGGLTAEIERAAIALGGVRALAPRLPDPSLLVAAFLRREAVLSSKIEGTRTQLGQLLLFEVGEEGTNEIDIEDAGQVHANYEAFQRGLVLLNTYPVSDALYRRVHETLFANANRLATMPGQFRSSSTRIGGDTWEEARFIPPPHTELVPLMRDLDTFINGQSSNLPLLVRIALIHYQFETVHPFCDGNGRVGRLLIPLFLKANGVLPRSILCLSSYFDQHKEEYVDRMLAVSQRGEWEEWIRFFLQAVESQATEDAERCNRLLNLPARHRQFFIDKKVNPHLLDLLLTRPVITIQLASDGLGVAFQTAQKQIEAMEGIGLLEEVTGRPTGRVYLSQPIINLLDRPLS